MEEISEFSWKNEGNPGIFGENGGNSIFVSWKNGGNPGFSWKNSGKFQDFHGKKRKLNFLNGKMEENPRTFMEIMWEIPIFFGIMEEIAGFFWDKWRKFRDFNGNLGILGEKWKKSSEKMEDFHDFNGKMEEISFFSWKNEGNSSIFMEKLRKFRNYFWNAGGEKKKENFSSWNSCHSQISIGKSRPCFSFPSLEKFQEFSPVFQIGNCRKKNLKKGENLRKKISLKPQNSGNNSLIFLRIAGIFS